jgi:L-alanine-DL-glutamate epimerase-like enolase superfamily enzyme
VAETVTDVRVARVLAPLPVVVRFGRWEMRHREFALCVMRSSSGATGTAFVYTRDAPLPEIVRRNVAPAWLDQPATDPVAAFRAVAATNNAVLAAGVGHRALSLVDLAAWDLAGRLSGRNLTEMLGGTPAPVPVTAIVGYPPSIGADEVAEQVRTLHAAGWRRFKQPIAATWELTHERLRAAKEAAPDCWHGMDANWTFGSAEEVREFATPIADLELGWIEDIVAPGNARLVREVREASPIPIAMGDEQGGSYHPEALVAAGAVDVARIDTTTNGGVTRFPEIVDYLSSAGQTFSTHMFAHAHSQLLNGLGIEGVPVEWGVPGSGVDQFADSLPQPVVAHGLMQPLEIDAGIGTMANPDWIREQEVEDPDGVLEVLR